MSNYDVKELKNDKLILDTIDKTLLGLKKSGKISEKTYKYHKMFFSKDMKECIFEGLYQNYSEFSNADELAKYIRNIKLDETSKDKANKDKKFTFKLNFNSTSGKPIELELTKDKNGNITCHYNNENYKIKTTKANDNNFKIDFFKHSELNQNDEKCNFYIILKDNSIIHKINNNKNEGIKQMNEKEINQLKDFLFN